MQMDIMENLRRMFPKDESPCDNEIGLGDWEKLEKSAKLLCKSREGITLGNRLRIEEGQFYLNSEAIQGRCKPLFPIESRTLTWDVNVDQKEKTGFWFPSDPLYPVPRVSGCHLDPLFQAKMVPGSAVNLRILQAHGSSENVAVDNYDEMTQASDPKIIWLNACNPVTDYEDHLRKCYFDQLSTTKGRKLEEKGKLCISPAFIVPLWLFPPLNRHLLTSLRRSGRLGFSQAVFLKTIFGIHEEIFPSARSDFRRCFYRIQELKQESNVLLSDFFAHLSYHVATSVDFILPSIARPLPKVLHQALHQLKAHPPGKGQLVLSKTEPEIKDFNYCLKGKGVTLWHGKADADYPAVVCVTISPWVGTVHLTQDDTILLKQVADCLTGLFTTQEEAIQELHLVCPVSYDLLYSSAFKELGVVYKNYLSEQVDLGRIEVRMHKVVIDASRITSVKCLEMVGVNLADFEDWRSRLQGHITDVVQMYSPVAYLKLFLYYRHGISLQQISDDALEVLLTRLS
jgi:hypothetical protein